MQEFSSVTASSYDADSLAPLLSQKSADGWEVVSIVSAGTNIVAYLRRESDGTSQDSAAGAADDAVTTHENHQEAPSHEPASDSLTDTTTDTMVDTAPSAVDEPAGWGTAVEPEAAPATPAAEPDSSIAALVAEVEATEAATDVAAEPAQAAAAESAVPAGWYADPSGRFELRYWDGAAWTEHVSRAGQQFTDPPVA
jgi:hypothetical protein